MTDENKLNKAYTEMHTMYDEVYKEMYLKLATICKGLSADEMGQLIELGRDEHYGIDNCLQSAIGYKKMIGGKKIKYFLSKKIKKIYEKCEDAFRHAEQELTEKTASICKDLSAEQTEQLLDFLPDKRIKHGIKLNDVECVMMLDEIFKELKNYQSNWIGKQQ